MMGMIIRKAEPNDVGVIKELWMEFIDFHKKRDPFYTRTDDGHERFGEYVLERIEKEDWMVLVAESKGEVAGYCMAAIQEYPPVFIKPLYGYIQDMAVSGKYRRNHIGRSLLEEITTWFRGKNIDRIELDVTAANEVSTVFWREMGFANFEIRMFKNI